MSRSEHELLQQVKVFIRVNTHPRIESYLVELLLQLVAESDLRRLGRVPLESGAPPNARQSLLMRRAEGQGEDEEKVRTRGSKSRNEQILHSKHPQCSTETGKAITILTAACKSLYLFNINWL